MSRCFPFPPPGYERKARIDDEEILEKEKHREKKHKKEKKDKEKRDGKEKREKDRSDGKHREKKDKKDKHKDRDKKKDKEDTDKAKDKSKIPDEKRLSGQTDPHGGEKLSQKEGKEKNSSVDQKFSGQVGGHKVEKLSHNSNLVDDSKFVKEFGRRIKDEATGTGSQLENFSGVDRKKDEGMLRLVAKGPSILAPGKEKDKRVEVKTTDGQVARDDPKPGGNAMVQNIGAVQNKLEGLPRLLDKNVERKIEGNEKTKDRESDDKRGVKSQEKDKEKKSHGKDKDRDREKKREDREKRKEDKQKKKEDKQRKKEDKEKKKEEKAKEKTQLTNAELDKIRGTNKHDLIDNHAIKPPQLPKESNSSAPADGNPKKRKDFETNGIAHVHDIFPGKLLTPTSSHPPTENGRILEHCQTTVPALDRKVASNNIKMDNKDRKINGVIEAQPSSISLMKVKPAAVAAAADQAKTSVRPSHPDTRYLSQIYSVPKMVEWSDYDDQEWLFDTNASQSKKPRVDPSGVEEPPQVWAEAQQIASADIFALPYVIPY